MPTFAYQARDASGEMTRGMLDADSLNEAGKQLRTAGMFVVKLAESKRRADAGAAAGFKQHYGQIKRDDVIHFAHQMSVMIETGVTLGEALQTIADQDANEHFAAVLKDVSETVQSGQAFSAALDRHSRVFPKLMISLLRASEASGTMGEMLERISTYLTKERNTIKSVRGAMTYPAVMMFVAVCVTIFLLAFVLPRFAKIYQNRGAALPAPTQFLLAASGLLTTYWYAWVGLAAAFVTTVVVGRRRPRGRLIIDWLKLNTPIFRTMFRQLYITRATRTMGTMIQAGVPMLDMIQITREITHNIYFERLWDDVSDRVQRGVQLSEAMFDSPLIPGTVSRMIHSGEKAGRLGMVMEKIADFTEHDFDQSVKRTTEFIEPAMVTIMGGLIGFVAISLLLPIFSVGQVMAS